MDDEIYLEIGQNLRRYRSEQGIKQSELAKKIGVSSSQYYKYEEGQSRPTIPKLIQMAELLDVSFDALMPADLNAADIEHQDENEPHDSSQSYRSDIQDLQSPLATTAEDNAPENSASKPVQTGFQGMKDMGDAELLGELISAFLALQSRESKEHLITFLRSL